MFQQNLLDSLQSIFGGGLDWNQLSGMGSQDIASEFAQHYDIEEQDLPAGMFQSITPEMLRGASYKTYAPQIQAQGQSFLPDLYKNLGGQAATKAAGGFAGSGGFGQQQAGVRDVYGKGMTDVLSNVSQQQSQGMGLISDLINQWHQSAQGIKGY